jgi:hypothetical protein
VVEAVLDAEGVTEGVGEGVTDRRSVAVTLLVDELDGVHEAVGLCVAVADAMLTCRMRLLNVSGMRTMGCVGCL